MGFSRAISGVGIGLRAPHYQALLEEKPALGFLEIHPENYFTETIDHTFLEKLRTDYPLSFHGVGLSLGSAQGVSTAHIEKLCELVKRYEPALVSDHASWSASGNAHMPDLLPLPYTRETLDVMQENIARVQDALKRPILIENPSTYLQFAPAEMEEPEFLSLLCMRAGCALLLDINNIYVNAENHTYSAQDYVAKIPPHMVREIHLAGHYRQDLGHGRSILIDTHNSTVCDAGWALYQKAVQRFGQVPTLIEWDADIPPLATLLSEVARAKTYLPELRYAG